MSIKQKLELAANQCKSPQPEATTGTAQRKARTRRLIQLGAIVDQYLGTVGLSPEAAEELLRELVELPKVREIIRNQKRPE